MRNPFGFLALGDSEPVLEAQLPMQENILFIYEDLNNHQQPGTEYWFESTELGGKGWTTGSVINGGVRDGDNNRAGLVNTTSPGSGRNAKFNIQTTGSLDVKAFAIVFNQMSASGGSTSDRNYFMDWRKANAESPDNGGFFNQYDGVAAGGNQIWATGSYWSYDESEGALSGSLDSTSANLTNGTGNNEGGTLTTQWLGPNGRALRNTKRLWIFNFNPNRPARLSSLGAEGLQIGTNSSGNEGASMGVYSVIAWDTALTGSAPQDLVDWYKDQGTIT